MFKIKCGEVHKSHQKECLDMNNNFNIKEIIRAFS